MKICFIADSSSIHVRRIVLHFLQKNDDVLVLSSAKNRSDIKGATTSYLLNVNNLSADISCEEHQSKITLGQRVKSLIPPSWKSFIKFTITSISLFSKRRVCIKEIERFNPEVIYCFRSFPEGILAAQCHVRPLLVRTAGPDICKFPRYPIYRQIIRKTLRSADVVLTESFWERKLVQQLCGAKVVAEVNLIGVDITLFRSFLSQDGLRAKYGLPRDSFVVVSNRYLDGHYNGWLVLKAMQSILNECPNLFILYVSPSRMDSHAKAKAAAVTGGFPRIKIVDGPLPHSMIPEILCCGDVYISFSSFDGIPNSLLEAMACGLVPVVAELPQLHEVIEHGETGYFVQHGDVKGLASLIRNLYNNREGLSEIAPRCVEQIRKSGSYDECMDRDRDLLAQLVTRAAVSSEKRPVSRVDSSPPSTASANQD